jgi:hypothetical protein
VHFAVTCCIKENDLLAAGQPWPQINPDNKGRAPGSAFDRLALDLNLDPGRSDPFIGRDRSNGEHNSTAQGGGNQLDGTGVCSGCIIAPRDRKSALSDLDLCMRS